MCSSPSIVPMCFRRTLVANGKVTNRTRRSAFIPTPRARCVHPHETRRVHPHETRCVHPRKVGKQLAPPTLCVRCARNVFVCLPGFPHRRRPLCHAWWLQGCRPDRLELVAVSRFGASFYSSGARVLVLLVVAWDRCPPSTLLLSVQTFLLSVRIFKISSRMEAGIARTQNRDSAGER